MNKKPCMNCPCCYGFPDETRHCEWWEWYFQ